MALQPGRGRTAVPVRSAIFGATLGAAAVTASLVFAVSLGHLLDTPRLAGFTCVRRRDCCGGRTDAFRSAGAGAGV